METRKREIGKILVNNFVFSDKEENQSSKSNTNDTTATPAKCLWYQELIFLNSLVLNIMEESGACTIIIFTPSLKRLY